MIETTIKKPELVKKRQKQICRGAIKISREKGFHATTMREISKETGIGLGNLYDYIKKKEDILFLIYKDIMDQVYRNLEEILEKYDSPLEQIVHMIERRLELDSKLKREINFIYRETKSLEKQYLREVLKIESNFVSKIEAIIERGNSQGIFDCQYPSLSANMIAFNMAILALRGWNIFPRHTTEELIKDLIRFTLRGLGAKTDL
jgi:AcrR family transcriptional regulator